MRGFALCLLPAALVGLAGCNGCHPLEEPDPGPPPVEWSADMQAVADGNNRFALDLYAKLKDEQKGNLFFSPYSAHTALAMTATGAKGTTRGQMVKVLHLPTDEQKALASGDLGRFYAHPRRDYQLAVANAVWGQKGFPWRPEFLAVQNDRFGAGFREADFINDPESECVRINTWAEEQTRGKIKDLLAKDVISKDTRMALANAIYFKGAWQERFDPKSTQPLPFTLADGAQVKPPTMHRKGGFRVYTKVGKDNPRQPEFQVAELPYKGGELSMVVILPGTHNGLPALEAKLTPEVLTGWLADAHHANHLNIYLPKFRIESGEMRLNEPLKKLGMVEAFDPGADFQGMHSSPAPLAVSHVIQKAFVDVSEEGTEAAAATVVVMTTTSAVVVTAPDFRADHPFLFLIRDVKRGTILFMGRVMNPTGG